MKSIHTNESSFGRFRRFLAGPVVERLRRWRSESATYGALMSLDDHTLKDIGISRSDIRAIAHGSWDCERRLDPCPPTVRLVVDRAEREPELAELGVERPAA